MPDKKEHKPRQASLLEANEDKADSIDKLVGQTFDSDPKVRLRIAQELGKIDDPRAIFALIELSSDKEEAVKNAARASLGYFEKEKEEIVSLEKLLSDRKEKKAQPVAAPSGVPATEQKQSMMPTIERLFSHYEPKKRESVKKKLFPSLQKLFGIGPQDLGDPLQNIDKIEHHESSSVQALREQEETEEMPRENAPNFPFGKKEKEEARAVPDDLVEIEDEDRVFVAPEEKAEAQEEESTAQLGLKYFDFAYMIATTPGMGKAELKREEKRIISAFRREVEASFKMAAARAKEDGFANFNGVKPGMKNLSFAPLPVASVREIAYGAKKKPYIRIGLWDEKKEMPVLLPKERAGGIVANDKVGLKFVAVDFLVESNEIVLVVGSKSQVMLVK